MRNKKTCALIVLLAACGLAPAACETIPSQALSPTPPERLIGRWQSLQIEGEASDAIASEALEFDPYGVFHRSTVYHNRQVAMTTGAYSIDGDTVRVRNHTNGGGQTFDYYMLDDRLIIDRKTPRGQAIITFTRVASE